MIESGKVQLSGFVGSSRDRLRLKTERERAMHGEENEQKEEARKQSLQMPTATILNDETEKKKIEKGRRSSSNGQKGKSEYQPLPNSTKSTNSIRSKSHIM